jgi:hypothetical protein
LIDVVVDNFTDEFENDAHYLVKTPSSGVPAPSHGARIHDQRAVPGRDAAIELPTFVRERTRQR